MKRLSLPVGLFCFAILLLSGIAKAQMYGCFYCKPVAPTGLGATCKQVGDGQNGDGWQCRETADLPWPDGPLCTVSGGPCYNVDVSGGGGSAGGGGSSSCQTMGFCPAECFSCGGGGGGRPAN